jgi:epoxyqueuosine reductase
MESPQPSRYTLGVTNKIAEPAISLIFRKNMNALEITRHIQQFTADSPANTLKNVDNEKAWGEPLVGFSRGDDPLYQQYKEIIGPFHWTPLEIIHLAFPDASVQAEELAIISWILPHTEAIKADLRKETINPSEKWIRARVHGEEFNNELRSYLAATLNQSGYEAVAPALFPEFKLVKTEQHILAAPWSERHIAYASGLGTFGLCGGLITAKGKAVRFGSVVVRLRIPPTPRPYDSPYEYCLFFAKGICGACIKRCPGQAISKSGHDIAACSKQCAIAAKYAETNFLFHGYGCGFCQTNVPCESRIPVRK